MLTRQELVRIEDDILAPYAQKSSNTRGRKHPETEHPLRTVYQRDRDRVVHCRAFRRLEYKTQVFVNHEGDHFRTRLTHTMEVAGIGRTIARILRLNEDLTEAICLAHDVGHPPFGHSGEAILDELMSEHGGFEHNLQSLRVVDILERKYPDFPGLNLSWETREGIMKHSSEYDTSAAEDPTLSKNPSLEGQIVCVADEIAYNSHDIDDGLDAGILSEEQMRNVTIWERANREFFSQHRSVDKEIRIYYGVRNVINHLVDDLTRNSLRLIRESGVESADDVRKYGSELIAFSPKVAGEEKELMEFLQNNVYRHPRVEKRNTIAKQIIENLFRIFLANTDLLSDRARVKLEDGSPHRVICDYIAGMTDRYAQKKYKELEDNSASDMLE